MSTLSIVFYAIAGLFAAGLIESIQSYRNAQLALTSRRRLSEMAARLRDPSTEADPATILRSQNTTTLSSSLGSDLYRAPSLMLYRAAITTPAWKYATFSLLFGAVVAWATLMLLFRIDAAIGLGCIAALLPWARALYLKRKRMASFEAQLPAALELMCRGLRAGHGLTSGLQMVAQELGDPIGPEFGIVSDEVALGLDTRDALKNLTNRIDAPDLTFLSTAILIQRETGGNLAEVMGRLAHVIRERHNFYGKVASLTAQNRGAAMILVTLPFIFIVLMHLNDPSFVEPLYTTPNGKTLATITGSMTALGYFFARRIANVRA